MDYAKLYPATHGKYFKPQDMMKIMKEIEGDPKAAEAASMASLHDPNILLLLSVFVGVLGIDRMYVGQIVLGILKLLTLGGYFIWWIIDLITVVNRTKELNFKIVMDYIKLSKG